MVVWRSCMSDPFSKLQCHELATVFDRFLPHLNAKRKYPVHTLRILDILKKCSAQYIGGHDTLRRARAVRCVLHLTSCHNRYCPKCESIDKEKWIINGIWFVACQIFLRRICGPRQAQWIVYAQQPTDIQSFFTTVWDMMKDFSDDKKLIGGKVGMTAILHTLEQNLQYHSHLHLIVPGCALMPCCKWKHARNRGK